MINNFIDQNTELKDNFFQHKTSLGSIKVDEDYNTQDFHNTLEGIAKVNLNEELIKLISNNLNNNIIKLDGSSIETYFDYNFDMINKNYNYCIGNHQTIDNICKNTNKELFLANGIQIGNLELIKSQSIVDNYIILGKTNDLITNTNLQTKQFYDIVDNKVYTFPYNIESVADIKYSCKPQLIVHL